MNEIELHRGEHGVRREVTRGTPPKFVRIHSDQLLQEINAAFDDSILRLSVRWRTQMGISTLTTHHVELAVEFGSVIAVDSEDLSHRYGLVGVN